MGKQKGNLNGLRVVIEVAALFLVVLLVKNHKLQMWLIVFIAGVILSIFAGRFFCGWICPMNTMFRLIDIVYKKLKIKRLETPVFMNNKITRMVFLILFITSMVVIKVLGLKLNILLFIILFSIAVTLVFQEELWHRHICPFGTILSLTSLKSKIRLAIDTSGCITCGKCQKVCPSGSIITLENNKRQNIANECLLCLQCIDTCPEDVCKIIK